MGQATRHPTAQELAQMGALIDSAMRDGAFGLGTAYLAITSYGLASVIGKKLE